MTNESAATINVTRLIDEGPVSAFQIMAIVLCSFVAFLDGMDTQSIAVAAPIIVPKLGLTAAAFGPIFSAALLGAMVGAIVFGPLGDRFGRKLMLILAALIFGAFTLWTAHASSYEELLAVRFLAGLGLGGATPCFIALASEYAPQRRRAMVASLIWAAFPLGGTVGGFLNAYILVNYGWETIFLIGGVLPIVVAAILLVWLPESIRYLLASGASPSRIGAIVARIQPGASVQARFVTDEEKVEGAKVSQLFTEGRAAGTLLLWVPFFAAFGILALTVVWTPVLLREHGILPAQASIAIGFQFLGSLLGTSVAGRLMERFGGVSVLVPALLLGAVSVGTLGYAAVSVPVMSVALFVLGVFVGTASSGSIALAALTYPTSIRSTGIGWAMGIGRFGQFLGPLFAGAMAAWGLGGVRVFLILAVAPVLGAMAILMLHARSTRMVEART